MTVVLVVEDESLIRMDAANMIEEAGYDVVEAGNADTAINILKRRNDIGILFTDINMPGSMNGLELAEFVSETWPSIRLILTSGRLIVRDEDIPDEGRFIPKPFGPTQIANVLHSL